MSLGSDAHLLDKSNFFFDVKHNLWREEGASGFCYQSFGFSLSQLKKKKINQNLKKKKENFETYYYKMAFFSNVEFGTGTGLQQWLPCTS